MRDALDFLAANHQELYVVPNYSYVCLGTSFFVPIHGSAVDYSTVADTICRVVLYDPDSDRIISAARDDAAFREHVYNQQSRVVVLRLYLLAKPKSSYFVHRETLKTRPPSDLLGALRDRERHECRDSSSPGRERKGHGLPGITRIPARRPSPALELPRDALGRLWDRLEENPVTSFLMHALSRHVAWHTELFFTPAEFDLFWRTHDQLPLRKIQLQISTPRRAASFALPRRGLRLGRPVHVSLAQVSFSGVSQEYVLDGPNQPRQTQQLGLACTTYHHLPRPMSRYCVSRSRISCGSI